MRMRKACQREQVVREINNCHASATAGAKLGTEFVLGSKHLHRWGIAEQVNDYQPRPAALNSGFTNSLQILPFSAAHRDHLARLPACQFASHQKLTKITGAS